MRLWMTKSSSDQAERRISMGIAGERPNSLTRLVPPSAGVGCDGISGAGSATVSSRTKRERRSPGLGTLDTAGNGPLKDSQKAEPLPGVPGTMRLPKLLAIASVRALGIRVAGKLGNGHGTEELGLAIEAAQRGACSLERRCWLGAPDRVLQRGVSGAWPASFTEALSVAMRWEVGKGRPAGERSCGDPGLEAPLVGEPNSFEYFLVVLIVSSFDFRARHNDGSFPGALLLLLLPLTLLSARGDE
ncbi:hypothetical protein VOLCADRAFT_101060 [Volvox carteri f. nagariensis]|uniref:Uncharacterized protein n=1 Tax=Volvox carteri f. nagariensis TaxID=3068 RepID=D8ULN2_VOLCA|nr:uncharacterized protein VOLCADRAFT_101060 [Volvox carteri f. nagariensis]EFJ39368.1 hypothetical protein VOLCADRAFT_101060 [Volvox carteri f. nagariensis]|eukprot:XP_002959569.1 hypothetical protein VOLCADRAFT_101060 [Volvox carteri f. nagariensis]